ncbi:MBL fold metallo-hydrolase [Streptomyces iconiensis]|uniref:MBL fold metallo-hydrolase n=1 Tax=Streptomyces iconiensis TaxID=1384038 RepID=A0ABT7A112_9ACTN|nr:MBL fold metallo-hydrolase [Streptomyces iconiensis]MDJ1134531.1 MBL fold metallo-hydrolase [Streptomyces iconiensis]
MASQGSTEALVTERLGENVFAFVQGEGGWGYANAGLVADGGEALLVDTFFTLAQTRTLCAAVEEAVPGARVGTVVNTHLNGDHCWGNQLFPGARFLTSAANVAGVDKEVSPALLRQLQEQPPPGEVGRYLVEHFGAFDFGGVAETRAWTTFSGRLTVQLGGTEVELLEVGPAHTEGDVAVHVPGAGVVFCGDLFFHRGHPVVWSGPLTNWAAACDRLLATGAETFVPGHGPLADRGDLAGFRDYLHHVQAHASRAATAGVPLLDAVRAMPLHGYEEWTHPERLLTAAASVYRELGAPAPESTLELLGLAACLTEPRASGAAYPAE